MHAVPPRQPFPAATAPVDGGVLPANGGILVYGDNELVLDDIGASITVDGRSVDTDAALIGCCTLSVKPTVPPGEGNSVTLAVSNGGFDATFTFTVGAADDTAPTLGVPEVVQLVNASRLVAPMLPTEGPAWIFTIDIPDVADDTGVAAIASYPATSATDVEGGALVSIEPPVGAPFERILTGVAGADVLERGEACVIVEVRDASGNSARAAPVCAPLPPPDDPPIDDVTRGDASGCASTGAAPMSALLVLVLALLAMRRVHIASSLALVSVVATSSCAGRDPLEDRGAGLCADGIVDHTWSGGLFDDAFFDEIARDQYGWHAVKVIVLEPERPQRRRVGFMDSDFYGLHDEWFYWRLANGVPACGAEDIAPLENSPGFATVADIQEWARAQERLPPFISWAQRPNDEPRLMAPDFYRLARDTEPRVYGPMYLTRDVRDEPRAYALRIGVNDLIERDELARAFEALDPLMPEGAPLYWKPSRNQPAHQALVDELRATNDPLADRVR